MSLSDKIGIAIIVVVMSTLTFIALKAMQPTDAQLDWAIRDAHSIIFDARERGEWSTPMNRWVCEAAEDRLEEMEYAVTYFNGGCLVSWEHWKDTDL